MQRWDGSIGTFSRAVCTACDDTTHPGGLSVSTSGASGYHQSLVLHASVRRECQTIVCRIQCASGYMALSVHQTRYKVS